MPIEVSLNHPCFRIPNIGEIEIDSTIAEATVEEAEAAEEFWDDFFSEL